MGHLDNLIRLRIYNIVGLITETFGEYIKIAPYKKIDVESWVNLEKFFFDCILSDGSKFYVAEEYRLVNYRLEISHYFYALSDHFGNMILSFDNAPHYPELVTFPHHKHFYPKSKHRPVGFSGDLKDALEEIRWIIEKDLN